MNRDGVGICLVGMGLERNWILGNWIREINSRLSRESHIIWTPSVYAGKRFWESLLPWRLPKSDAYFFIYPTMFRYFLMRDSSEFEFRSIVNYTHNLPELGTDLEQVNYLNRAFSVHFNSSLDAKRLVASGLDPMKVRLVHGAVDDDCRPVKNVARQKNLILLASRFSERKGVHILPEIIEGLPNWEFQILGRKWEKFLKQSSLHLHPRVKYEKFTKESRNYYMSKGSIFLSLSALEGGPIPLLEAITMGMFPIATDTGFAGDFIPERVNGHILSNPTSPTEVISAVNCFDCSASQDPRLEIALEFSWTRIASIVKADFDDIKINQGKRKCQK